jgi:hypothetical protein
VAEEARRRGADGVICGHIHKAEMRQIGDILYVNDGDWVESCTALAEHEDGRLEIIEWGDRAHGNRPFTADSPVRVSAGKSVAAAAGVLS